MNHILDQHTPTEMEGFEKRFEKFRSSHSIDLPVLNFEKHLKGTGVQVRIHLSI